MSAIVQFAISTQNARLDAIEADVGTSAHLLLYSGSMPADCASVDPNSILADIALPTDWMAAASGGVKSMLGTWTVTATLTGTITHFRILESSEVNCKMQGNVTVSGGGGAMTVDNINAVTGFPVTITQFTLRDGNS